MSQHLASLGLLCETGKIPVFFKSLLQVIMKQLSSFLPLISYDPPFLSFFPPLPLSSFFPSFLPPFLLQIFVSIYYVITQHWCYERKKGKVRFPLSKDWDLVRKFSLGINHNIKQKVVIAIKSHRHSHIKIQRIDKFLVERIKQNIWAWTWKLSRIEIFQRLEREFPVELGEQSHRHKNAQRVYTFLSMSRTP